MIAVTLGTFYQKRFVAGGDLRTTTVWQYVGGTLAMVPLVLLFGRVEADWNLTLSYSIMSASASRLLLPIPRCATVLHYYVRTMMVIVWWYKKYREYARRPAYLQTPASFHPERTRGASPSFHGR